MAELTVLQSIAFREAFLELAPRFDQQSGHRTRAVFDGGVQVMQRLLGGEAVDLVIMSADKIDELIAAGCVVPGGRTDLAVSPMAVAVRAGAPKPDIGSSAALQRALLAARRIAYSTGPSGVHLAQLIEQWGLSPALAGRMLQVKGEPAGAALARGDADLGFQQLSELLPVAGIDIIGPMPDDAQRLTRFAIGLHRACTTPDAARALMRYLASPQAAATIREKGMLPVAATD
jgi:molybdate transport system substrate-binding protein